MNGTKLIFFKIEFNGIVDEFQKLFRLFGSVMGSVGIEFVDCKIYQNKGFSVVAVIAQNLGRLVFKVEPVVSVGNRICNKKFKGFSAFGLRVSSVRLSAMA